MRYNLNNFINNTAIWNLSFLYLFFSGFASEHMMDIKLCFNTLSLAVLFFFLLVHHEMWFLVMMLWFKGIQFELLEDIYWLYFNYLRMKEMSFISNKRT